MRRYADFINADSGLTFAEYLGIEVPRLEVETRRGEFRYRYRTSKATGEWARLKGTAKANYKAALGASKERRPA
jgi:hypothetical protein